MKLWRWILLLVIAAAIAAFGWHWVAEDPGYVLVRFRGITAQTSLLAAVVLLLLAVVAITMLWRLARWPFGAFSRRHRRLSQQRLAEGLVALMEGRHSDAERDLHRACADRRCLPRPRPLRGVGNTVAPWNRWVKPRRSRRVRHECCARGCCAAMAGPPKR